VAAQAAPTSVPVEQPDCRAGPSGCREAPWRERADVRRQYAALIHPDVSYDFRGQALGNSWADPHVYNDPSGIYNGVIGSYGGARFMETPSRSAVR
jgi:hypothetical protein